MFFLQLLSLFTLLAFCFSVVMLLSMMGGAADLQRDIRPERQGRYCLLMQLLYAALLALVFWTAGASEVRDYRAAWEADQQVGEAVVEVLKEDFPEPWANGDTRRIGILNILPTYLEEQNYYYHEHIHGCTESSWAFQGLLTCLGGEGTWNVTPLPLEPVYYHWNQTTNRPETFDVLYWYDGETIFPIELTETGEHCFQVLNGEGELMGEIWEDWDGKGYFTPEQG